MTAALLAAFRGAPPTGRSVAITTNDRPGTTARRIIDLSFGAARRLGILRQGVVEVWLAPAV